MSILYVPIGISGSGKSTLGNKIVGASRTRVVVVCPDDERKRLTGNVSDQSRNDDVFSACHGLVRKHLACGDDVFFSATNLSRKDRKMLFKIAKDTKSFVMGIVLMDSMDPTLCYDRVKKDLESGVDRSNTTIVLNEESQETVISRMFQKFKANYPVVDDFDGLMEYSSKDEVDWKNELESIIKIAHGE